MATKSQIQFKKSVKLNQYAGEWIALVGKRIVAHNKDLRETMTEVEKKGLKERASVFLVPRKDEGPYILVVI